MSMSMNLQQALALLGIVRPGRISRREIVVAYHAAALVNHPDKTGSSNATNMQQVNDAYAMLIEASRETGGIDHMPPQPPPGPPPNVHRGVVVQQAHWRAAEELMNAISTLPRGHSARSAAGGLRNHIGKLNAMTRLAAFFCRVLEIIADSVRADELHFGRRRSWADLGWKEMSFNGYDVRTRTQTIDYGNKEYRTFARALSLTDPRINVQLVRLSFYWLSMHPDQPDTWDTLDRQGDLVEIFLAALRGEDFFLQMLDLDGSQLQMLFAETCACMRAIHWLNAVVRTGYVKYRKEHTRRLRALGLGPQTRAFEERWCARLGEQTHEWAALIHCLSHIVHV